MSPATPRLLLVDEFAHTNAAGLMHTKRYRDVEEVLRHGIDVWTTLNIQHLESLQDVVQRITGVRVHETVPDKILGVVVMGAAVMILFLLPWLDKSSVRSIRYRGPITKIALALFRVAFVTLGYLGMQAGSELQKLVAQICTGIYFLFFILMPVYTKMDSVKPVPDRVTTHD